MTRGLQKSLDSIPLDWLLLGKPHVRYRTYVDLLGASETEDEIKAIGKSIPGTQPVNEILLSQNDEGYWGSARDIYTWWPKKDTTFWILGVFADFGLRRHTKRIASACEYVFSTQHEAGGFGWGPPHTSAECFTGILVEALAKLGYVNDPRIERAYDWLMSRQRGDGGFWCKNTGQPGMLREGEPSCAFASLCILGAIAQHPIHSRSQVARETVRFLLGCWENRDKIKYAGHDSQVGKGWAKLKYPFTDYRVLKYVDVMSRFPSARTDRRMNQVLDLLLSKRDVEGRFYAESIHRAWSAFDFGQKRFPSRWLTLLAYRAIRRVAGDTPSASGGS